MKRIAHVTYTWKCSCIVEIDDTTTPKQIREQIWDAAADNNETTEEGPNDVRVSE